MLAEGDHAAEKKQQQEKIMRKEKEKKDLYVAGKHRA